mmetsp:Transcript_41899/g.103323  ORF Transcript_41899/g.103323 Transcript_41899/m.103323 type:complete len:285 (+) Transcript_41899:324-1178(+)
MWCRSHSIASSTRQTSRHSDSGPGGGGQTSSSRSRLGCGETSDTWRSTLSSRSSALRSTSKWKGRSRLIATARGIEAATLAAFRRRSAERGEPGATRPDPLLLSFPLGCWGIRLACRISPYAPWPSTRSGAYSAGRRTRPWPPIECTFVGGNLPGPSGSVIELGLLLFDSAARCACSACMRSVYFPSSRRKTPPSIRSRRHSRTAETVTSYTAAGAVLGPGVLALNGKSVTDAPDPSSEAPPLLSVLTLRSAASPQKSPAVSDSIVVPPEASTPTQRSSPSSTM